MSTVSKGIADRVIAGEFPEDNITKIVEYTNAWGKLAYGLIFNYDNPNKYSPSEYVINPTTYWEKPK